MPLDTDLMAVLGDQPQAQEEQTPVLSVVTEQTVNPLLAQWLRFKPQFVEAMDGSIHSVEDLERKIGQGRAYLFPGKDAAIVGEKAEYSNETVFQALWGVGDLEEIEALIPGVEAFARLIGCKSMLVEGRRGWEKLLKPRGYDFWSVTVRKEL